MVVVDEKDSSGPLRWGARTFTFHWCSEIAYREANNVADYRGTNRKVPIITWRKIKLCLSRADVDDDIDNVFGFLFLQQTMTTL